MHTQCPHCETKFRVTETQVNIAEGFVRCGVCKEVFNAFEVASQQDQQPSLLNDEFSPAVEQSDIETDGIEADIESRPSHSYDTTYHEISENDTAEILPDVESDTFNETAVTDVSQKDTFDFFNQEDDESHQHLIPEELRDSDAPQSRGIAATSLWAIGILLLTTSLLIEYVWFNRDQFNQSPIMQSWIARLCQQLECENSAIRDASKIELITRNVYSHPNAKNALMVNLTLKNNANFAQPYPVLHIGFSDVRGGTIAARQFLPAEYLPIEYQQIDSEHHHLIQPGSSTSLTMELQDPGKQALTYEFNFL